MLVNEQLKSKWLHFRWCDKNADHLIYTYHALSSVIWIFDTVTSQRDMGKII